MNLPCAFKKCPGSLHLHYSDLGQIGEKIEEVIQNNKSTSWGEYKQ